ncbi:phospho-sugar mutase [Exiguobacterium oxidotolerans]|uniref:Phosphoglucomutase n=1 Tax=Exiguobacterium oxidotolerans TaxID=223958 RepID=A0A653I911_9BACL|nr:phospho-sugar mutase [Exiguobacterium oxidotolerans]VWX35668.1 alpha-phosphoglucomutase [Exiguobacterium oxidotolerans]
MNYIEKSQQWFTYSNLNSELKAELNTMWDQPNELEDRFYKALEFGTGGMRGELGVGTNRLNIYTVRKAIDGLARYIVEQGEEAMQRGVVVAYDSRHKSEEFAIEIAQVLGHYNIKSYVFDALRPTPELSFSIRYLNTFAGIVITASHNPPAYNGIKIYGEDGGQMSLEMAEVITSYINQIENELMIPFVQYETLLKDGLLQMIGEEFDKAYLAALDTLQLRKVAKSDMKIVFTPLHGTAHRLVPEGLKRFGFENVVLVDEQMTPDPEFSTVVSPNPEEHAAFEYAIRYGQKHDADILLATDPDADRLGVAVKNDEGQYEVLTGNQTGALMLQYILEQKKQLGTLPVDGVVLKTIVTSEIGRTIAQDYGMETIDTLTGFKFIGEKIKQFEEQSSHTFLFGYEESYGYLIKEFVRDKDAVQAAVFIAEVAAYYHEQGITLHAALLNLMNRYGYYQEDLVSLTLKGKDGATQIQEMMNQVRLAPIKEVAGRKVVMIEDYLSGQRNNLENEVMSQIDLPTSNVLKLYLEGDAWVTLRPSGTEPKIKFYFSVKEDTLALSKGVLRKLKKEFMDAIQGVTI